MDDLPIIAKRAILARAKLLWRSRAIERAMWMRRLLRRPPRDLPSPPMACDREPVMLDGTRYRLDNPAATR